MVETGQSSAPYALVAMTASKLGASFAQNSSLACVVLRWLNRQLTKESYLRNIIYIVGLVVVVIAVLSFFGLR